MAAVRYLSVKNLERYMHYKDRRPPWVKLHADLLDDYEFRSLPDATKAHLLLLTVLASQMENRIPYDLKWLSHRIGATAAMDIEELILGGYLELYDANKKSGLPTRPSRYVSAQMRKNVFALAENKCANCEATEKLDLDFVVPIAQGGSADMSNLQVLCTSCSRQKRVLLAQEATEAPPPPKKQRRGKEDGLLTLIELPPLPEPEPSWPALGQEWWVAEVGVVSIPQFGKAIKPVVDTYGWEATFAGLQEYVGDRKRSNKPARLEWFVGESTQWIQSAKEPTTDEYGDLTEKGKRIAGIKK